MPLADLAAAAVPERVALADDLVTRVDHALLGGFARLSSEGLAALEALGRAFAGTPLAAGLAGAVAGVSKSEFVDRHFLVIAAARASIQGAQHDALIAQLSAALGRPPPRLEPIPASAAQAPPPSFAVWMESARHFLMEIALAGFANLGLDALLPFQATLDAIQAEPRLARQGALLGGFLDELLAVFPAKGTPEIPLRRWADLWTRAMVLAAGAPAPLATRPATGELRVLAADLRQHATFASLVVFASLREGSSPPRLVRAALSAYKVDVIQGEEIGSLLWLLGPNLLDAIGRGKTLAIRGVPLTATNDLVWDDDLATPTGKFSIMEEAAAVLSAAPADRPCLDPADRHPALIEELVYLAGYGVPRDTSHLLVDKLPFPIAHDRWPDTDDLAADHLPGSTALVGLLRFDGGRWSLEPLAIDAIEKKKSVFRAIGSSLGATRGKKTKDGVYATLKERAGKLLRQKTG
jgi:hypothetical protein